MDELTNKEFGADRILQISEEIQMLLEEARGIAEAHLGSMGNVDAYVFEQIREHLTKTNPYNQDLEDVANAVRSENEDED